MTFNITIDIHITSSKIMALIIAGAGIFYGFYYKDPAAMEILVAAGSGIYFHKNHIQLKEKLNGGNK